MAGMVAMWRSTRMIVLTAICAALYAAVLIPFKALPIIPGISEIRPANALPVVCSFLFGPAAAWGAGFGNLIAEFFGGLGPGDVFGALANVLYGLVPYAMWEALTDRPPVPRGVGSLLALEAVIVVASVLCATVVGWGLHLLGFHPFTVVGTVVLVNNVLAAGALAPLLLVVLWPRIARARLLHGDVLPRARVPAWRRVAGCIAVVVGTAGGFAVGNLAASHRWTPPWIPVDTASGQLEVGLGVAPFLALAVAGLAAL